MTCATQLAVARWLKWIFAGWCLAFLTAPGSIGAELTLQMSFNDPGRKWAGFYPAITSNLKAAVQDWGQYLESGASLEVEIVFVDDHYFRVHGSSVASSAFATAGGGPLYEQGVATEIRTGKDPNGDAPDVRLEIGTYYLANRLWFDPDPVMRTAPVPADKVDALSVFMHEIGHALGFNGWTSPYDGSCSEQQKSTFDRWVRFDGTNFFFHGPQAMANYGGPVPLTYGNVFHVGNAAPRPGRELASDVMNGEANVCGERYYLSRLDLGMLADADLPVKIPLPALTRARLDAGRVQFQVNGPRWRWYRVEVSTDLVRWAWVMDYVSTHSAMTIVPEDDFGSARRYYRAQIF